MLRRSHPRIGGEGAQLGASFPHQSVLHDLRRRQFLFHGLMCYPQLLVALLQFPGPFRNQCLKLFLAVEDLNRHVVEDARQAADLVGPVHHRSHGAGIGLFSGFHQPGGFSNDLDRMRQKSRAEERGHGGETERRERDQGRVPRFAAHRERNVVQADGNGQATDQDPTGVDDRGCDHDAAVIG